MNATIYATALALALVLPAAAEDKCPRLTIVESLDLVPGAGGLREYVPVEIAGVPKLMILDIGADISILTGEVADELKLSTQRSNSNLYSVTGAYTDRETSVEVKLGHKKGTLKLMVDPHLNGLSSNPKVAGLLGTDVLSNFDLSIDFAANKLDLLDPNHCEGKVLYWPATVAAIVPFKLGQYGHIVFDVTLDGKTFKAVLDTGAPQSTLRITAAESQFDIHPGTADTPEVGGLNERTDLKTYRHVFKTLDFNGIVVSNPNFELIPDMTTKKLAPSMSPGANNTPYADIKAPILIGMNELRHLHLYIAYKEKKLYITPAGTSKTN